MPHDWFPPVPTGDHPPAVLSVVGDRRLGDAVARELEGLDYDVEQAADAAAALASLHERAFEVCVLCDTPGGEVDRAVRAAWSRVPAATQLVRVLNEDDGHDTQTVVHPWATSRLRHTLAEAAGRSALVQENDSLRRRLVERLSWFTATAHDEVGAFRDALLQASHSRDDVVIVGEPGALLAPWARLVHESGPRSRAPFVRIDGRTLTADTFATDHETGGRVAEADGGVVFLDHTEETAEAVRDRVRQRNPHLRIAGSPRLPTQFVVGVEQPTDAESVFEHETARVLAVPPLRTRLGDVGAIATGLLEDVASRFGEATRALTTTAVEALCEHDWPGNERELSAVLECAFRAGTGRTIDADDVRAWIGTTDSPSDDTGTTTLRDMERRLIEATFARCNGNREQTAKSLGIGVRTLSGKLREYGYPPRGGPGSNRRPRREAA